MIGYLNGKLIHLAPQRVLVDVRGVGYVALIPLSTYYELQKLPEGKDCALHIYTHVREGVLELYGFWTEREKQVFEKLITVSGIGPKLAQAVLSGMAPEDLVSALAGSDVVRLNTIPGVGKKTAERMVLELRDKVGDLAASLPQAPEATGSDLVPALINLGYRQSAAEKAVAQAAKDNPGLPFPELLRASLKLLSRA